MKKPAKLYLVTIGMIKLRDILEASNSTDSPGTKGYSGFTDASMWDKYKKFLEKNNRKNHRIYFSRNKKSFDRKRNAKYI